MSEIKVGEHVRTKKGLLAKVCAYQDLTTYDDKGISVTFHSFDTDKGTIADVEVAKHDKKIVNLLECEDILKIDIGFSYTLFYVSAITNDEIIDGTKIIRRKDIGNFVITDGPYKGCKFTIVTKEQFKNIEYKVGE